VAERLGQSTVTLTPGTYSHVLPDMQWSAAAKPEQLGVPHTTRAPAAETKAGGGSPEPA